MYAIVNPPSRQAATLSGCPSRSLHSCSSAASSRSSDPPAHQGARRACSRRRSRRRTIPVHAHAGSGSCTSAPGRPVVRPSQSNAATAGPHDEVGRAAVDGSAPSPVTSTTTAVVVHFEDHVVVPAQRQPERVEPRAQVRAGGRHAHAHGRDARSGSSVKAERRSLRRPRRPGWAPAPARPRSPSRGP